MEPKILVFLRDGRLLQPQSIDEISASVKALLRWTLRINNNREILELQELKLLPESRQALLDGEEFLFTRIEFVIGQVLLFKI